MGGPARLKLLLDTHVWLWSRLEPERLGPALAARLRDPDTELWLSPISLWEGLLLAERGRLEIPGAASDWLERALRTWPLRDAPLNRAVAMLSRSIDLPHGGPADRLIAASAVVHELTLATADERLLACDRYDVIANR